MFDVVGKRVYVEEYLLPRTQPIANDQSIQALANLTLALWTGVLTMIGLDKIRRA